jgi:hypothetical protein
MGVKTGNEAKAYHNTGTYGTPVWDEITNIRDLTVSVEKNKIDASKRGSTWRLNKFGLKDASVDFQMLFDEDDTDFAVIRDMFFAAPAAATQEFALMSEDIATVGSEGLRALMEVASFTKNEPLEDVQTVDVSLAPVPSSDADPAWYEITS